MLELNIPNYKFCPFCGQQLKNIKVDGKKRKFCPNDNWTYFPHVATSAAVVICQDNKVLLVQRNRKPHKGTWMFPAGFSDYGEHPSETAAREVLEETGYKVKDLKIINILQVEDDPRQPGHLAIFYKASLSSNSQAKIADIEENQDMGWFSINNLPKIGWKSHQKIAKLLKRL